MSYHGLKDTVAVVTGAAQGNGAAIARGFAKHGAQLALIDLNGDALASLRDDVIGEGGEAISFAADVADAQTLRDVAQEVRAHFGSARSVVANAGVIRRSPVGGEGYEADWDAIFNVNVTGVRNTVLAFLDQLKETRGAIVTLGSIMSMTGAPNVTAYAASKGAVAQFTRALAFELAPEGVRANALAPGVIATPMTEVTRANPDAIGRFNARTPMGRVGQPEEIVGPALFLASDDASYVTGAVLPVDGGYLAG